MYLLSFKKKVKTPSSLYFVLITALRSILKFNNTNLNRYRRLAGDINEWSESHSVMSDSLWSHGLYSPWNSPGQNTGVGSLSLLQGIFPTQGSNPGLPHCGQILYQLSHQGSPRILEWVAYPFSSRSSWPRNRTGVSCKLQVDSLSTELWGKLTLKGP